jgi:acyl dehydratase
MSKEQEENQSPIERGSVSFSGQGDAVLSQYADYFASVSRFYSGVCYELVRAYLDSSKVLMTATEAMTKSLIKDRGATREVYSFTEKGMPQTPQMRFEELTVGISFTSGETEITNDDIRRFADLTGDANKLHVDPDYAKSVGFKGVIAHGMFTLSIALGLWHSLNVANDTTLAFVGINNVSFKAPVYPGDRLKLYAEVIGARESKSKPNAGLITLKMKVLNSESESVVLEAEPVLLILKKQQPSNSATN